MKIQILAIIVVLSSLNMYLCSLEHTSVENMIMDSMLNKEPEEIFKAWHQIYKKDSEYKINSKEYNHRFTIFAENIKKVRTHNADITKSWKLALNLMSDKSPEELRQNSMSVRDIDEQIKGLKQQKFDVGNFYLIDATEQAEFTLIDWTPYTGPMFNQKSCGDCYNFSMMASIESNYSIKTGKFVELSKQQVVDCNPLTNGCKGSFPLYVAAYHASVGSVTEQEYPYVAKELGSCNIKTTPNKYISGLEGTLYSVNESYFNSKTVMALLKKGPVSILFTWTQLYQYAGGIVELDNCNFNDTHAVLLVGYGVENGVAYWKIKNQWDSWWGEKGYLRIKVKDTPTFNCYLNRYAFRAIP